MNEYRPFVWCRIPARSYGARQARIAYEPSKGEGSNPCGIVEVILLKYAATLRYKLLTMPRAGSS
jgi:hypothetical protein